MLFRGVRTAHQRLALPLVAPTRRILPVQARQFGLFDKIFGKKEEEKKVEKKKSTIQEAEVLDEQEDKFTAFSKNEFRAFHQEKVQEASIFEEAPVKSPKKKPSKPSSPKKKNKGHPTLMHYSKAEIEALIGKSSKVLNRVESLQDKIDDVQILSNGRVVHKQLKTSAINKKYKRQMQKWKKQRKYNPNLEKPSPMVYLGFRSWPDMKTFRKWRANWESDRAAYLKKKLTPLEFYVTQGMGQERPFTGEFWWTKDVGQYSCKVCTQKLFMSDHKYEDKSGFPTFWHNMIDAVDFKSDHLERPAYTNAHEDPTLKNKEAKHRVVCSNCESHLGLMFDDGPAPLGKRMQLNSVALTFEAKPWFEQPISKIVKQKIRKQVHQSKKGMGQFLNLLGDERYMNIPSFENRIKREKANVTRANRLRNKKKFQKLRALRRKQKGSSEESAKFDIRGQAIKE